MTRGTSLKLGAALIVIGGALLLSGRNSNRLVNGYVAEAIIQVSKPQADDISPGDTLRAGGSILESTAVIDGIISNLNLMTKWSQTNQDNSLARIRHRLSGS